MSTAHPFYEITFDYQHACYHTVIWDNQAKTKKLASNTHSRYKYALSWARFTVKRLTKAMQ